MSNHFSHYGYSTGSAGIIQLSRMFSGNHLAPGILGIIATVGWTLQGVGNAWYYRQVRQDVLFSRLRVDLASRYGDITVPQDIRWTRQAH
jgi:hypothetical protein